MPPQRGVFLFMSTLKNGYCTKASLQTRQRMLMVLRGMPLSLRKLQSAWRQQGLQEAMLRMLRGMPVTPWGAVWEGCLALFLPSSLQGSYTPDHTQVLASQSFFPPISKATHFHPIFACHFLWRKSSYLTSILGQEGWFFKHYRGHNHSHN